MTEADVAEMVADHLEEVGVYRLVDWNDLGEVTVHIGDKIFRMTVIDITGKDY